MPGLQRLEWALGNARVRAWDATAPGIRRVRRAVHRATRFARLDPTFLIIGAAKSGTTSLHETLVRHPALGASLDKEPRYFDVNYGRGRGWYRAQFPLRSYRLRTRLRFGVEPAVGEATPYYLFHPHVPSRVRRDYPEMKLIAVLRDPIERAYSHYQHQVRIGREQRSFEQAVAEEAELIGPELERMLADQTYESDVYRRYSYVSRGLYAEQLERWLARFPAQQLLVLSSEDLFARPADTLAEICRFLGIPAVERVALRADRHFGYAELSPRTRKELADGFAEPNRRLCALLGRDFGWACSLET
jgi:hypothetical protein